MARTVNAAKWRKKREERDSTVIDFGEHGKVTVPPPILWPAVRESDGVRESDQDYLVRIIGEEAAAIVEAAGYTRAQLAAMVMEAIGAPLGE